MYAKNDKEYVSNGHYLINGNEFMSIWTFKKIKGIEPNFDGVNGPEGIKLFDMGIESHESKPDFGNYDTVQIYPISELIKFYNK